MSAIALYRSAVGKKAAMAASGLVLFGFVLLHLLGNLQVFLGADKLNAYSRFLHSLGGLLWAARLILLGAVLVHIVAAYQVAAMQRAARPIGYARRQNLASTYASRTMKYGGVVILLFIVYHLLHFTFGNAHPAFNPDDVYANVVTGFRVVPVALFYIAAQLALGLHLRHGVWSLFQSAGIHGVRLEGQLKLGAAAFAAFVTLGNISIPVAVLAGLVHL